MSPSGFDLVGDIGGTNARFAVVEPTSGELTCIEALACADYPSFEEAIASYLELVKGRGINRACMAVAGIVSESPIQMTNNPWRFEPEKVREKFGWRECLAINDFSAMALGTLQVADDQLHYLCGGPGDASAPRLVMGPGTGLGMAGLVPCGQGWITLNSEGGHVDFAPTDELEIALLRFLKRRYPRVSVERILSGPGLVNLYQAMGEVAGSGREAQGSPAEIVKAALSGEDSLAVNTLNRFCQILGRVAGDAVLTLGSIGGVYLCGGILPRMLDFLQASSFQASFEDKGRMSSLVESTPVYVVTDTLTGLRGAAAALSGGAQAATPGC